MCCCPRASSTKRQATLTYNKAIDDKSGQIFALSVLAHVAFRQHNYEAARQHAQGAILTDAVMWLSAVQHSPAIEPRLQRFVDAYLAEIKPQLSEDQFEQAFEHGQTLTLDPIAHDRLAQQPD